MKSVGLRSVFAIVSLYVLVFTSVAPLSLAQSKPQRPDAATGDGKKNNRPKPLTEEEIKAAEAAKKLAEEEKNAVVDDTLEKVETNIVTIDAVVLNKKTGQVITGLNKSNFAIFENGVKQNVTNFAAPEAPITVSLLVEFSKWSEIFGAAAGGGFEPGSFEVIKPVAYFVSKFVKAPDDYASIVAFDLRPTPITDFTNDPNRLRQAVDLLLRNRPAFRENNLYDALKFTLIGGKGDSVVLDDSKEEKSDYAGMTSLKTKRKAIILVASGIDTFSRINYDEIRRIIQEAGVPIYIISTGNLFFKRYESYLDPARTMPGMPDRMTFLQATNVLNTIAKESGGVHYPMTFEGEIPGYLNNINALMRNQYSLAYDITEPHTPGAKYKLQVKVDVDGDGTYDDKTYVVQHRPFYIPPGGEKSKKGNRK